MSLITLHSEINEISSKSIENAYIRNNFKDGIQIRKGDTMTLVSLTVTKQKGISISDDNDTLVFRLGGRAQWNQNTVVLTHGTYTADEIAVELEVRLNEAVMVGVFKQGLLPANSGFRVVHTAPVAPATKATITITMIPQAVAPLPNYNLFRHYDNDENGNVELDEINPNFDAGGGDGLITIGKGYVGENIDPGFPHPCPWDDQAANSMYMGSHGIFGNGGVHEVVSGAVFGLKYRNALTFSTAADGISCNNEKVGAPIGWLGQAGGPVTCKIEAGPAGATKQEWSYMVTFGSPVRKFPVGNIDNTTATVGYLWLERENNGSALDKNNGQMRMGWDGATTDASDPSEWNAPYNTWWYDAINKSINAMADGSFRPTDGKDLAAPEQVFPYFTQPASGPIAAGIVSNFQKIGNLPVICGFVNNNLGTALEKYPGGGVDTAWASTDIDLPGMNVIAELVPSFDGSQIPLFSLYRLNGLAGAFPGGVWREQVELIPETRIDQVNPRDTTGADILPGFVPGNAVRVQIEVTGIRGIIVSLSHKADWRDQTTAWSAPHIVADNGTNAVPAGSPVWNKVLKEGDYPLRPMTAACSYVHYGEIRDPAVFGGTLTSDPAWQGKYDELEYENNLGSKLVDDDDILDEEDDDEDAEIPPLGAPVAISLSQMWKFGFVTAGPSTTTQVPAADLIPNVANVAQTLGFTPSSIHAAVSPLPPIVSAGAPLGSVVHPNISVELQDFRIQGFNGKTSDTAKAIAIIPKEELSTGDDSGTLHYQAPFPIPIDLNVPHDSRQYSITAMLRDSDGKVLDDLSYPTEIVLLHERSALAKQEDMMERILERLSLKQSSNNSNKISNIGEGNPVTTAI